MTATTDTTVGIDTRQAAVERARTLVGDDATLEQTFRVAEWLLTGAFPIDPDRIEKAARSLASSQGQSWDALNSPQRNTLRGDALRAITAYLRAA
jgi:DnaJ-domain-containing protein 1